MASTYSALKIELIGTGDQAGAWGATTNTNLDVALGEVITGSADVAYTSAADVTVTLTNTNTAQTARNLRLNITESGAGVGYVGNLILGSGCQIEKLYLVNNTTTAVKTIKNTTGTGIAVPAGKSMFVFNDGTNVVDAITHLSSLTLSSALTISSGGTGAVTLTANNVLIGNGTSAVQFVAPSTSGNLLTSNGTTWVSSTPGGGGQFFGSAAIKAIAYNSNTIAENITVTAGNNGYSAGPITINSTFTVTVDTGAVWVIV